MIIEKQMYHSFKFNNYLVKWLILCMVVYLVKSLDKMD